MSESTKQVRGITLAPLPPLPTTHRQSLQGTVLRGRAQAGTRHGAPNAGTMVFLASRTMRNMFMVFCFYYCCLLVCLECACACTRGRRTPCGRLSCGAQMLYLGHQAASALTRLHHLTSPALNSVLSIRWAGLGAVVGSLVWFETGSHDVTHCNLKLLILLPHPSGFWVYRCDSLTHCPCGMQLAWAGL